MALVKLYDKMLSWAEHKYAPRYLALVSFAESSFFPIPPDVMLAPMSLANPAKAFRFALIATLASVFGGVAGYFLGLYAFEPIVYPFLSKFGYLQSYEQVLFWFKAWGFWMVFLAGFSPIPYKLFTIGAGVLKFNLPLFFLASLIGRAGRFYLVSALIRWGGKPLAAKLRTIVDRLGFALITAFLLIIAVRFVW